jgi:hypothetical protein
VLEDMKSNLHFRRWLVPYTFVFVWSFSIAICGIRHSIAQFRYKVTLSRFCMSRYGFINEKHELRRCGKLRSLHALNNVSVVREAKVRAEH